MHARLQPTFDDRHNNSCFDTKDQKSQAHLLIIE
jgi:hypothetical protein